MEASEHRRQKALPTAASFEENVTEEMRRDSNSFECSPFSIEEENDDDDEVVVPLASTKRNPPLPF